MYDNIGNRVTSREGSGASAAAYTANSLNQYTAITREEEAPFAPGYDADGNQTKIQTSTGEWEVSYNALNQAARFIQGNRRVECRYDYLNRRIEKAVYEGEVLMSKNDSFITATCKSRNWTSPTRWKQRCPYCEKPICGILWNR